MNSQKLEDDEVPIVRINTVSELPVECLSGFIVEVKNSFDGQNRLLSCSIKQKVKSSLTV